MRARIFKIAGATILTIAVIWALVLAWWQSNDYQPSTSELALYLGVLPLALVGGFWLLYGFIEQIKNPPPRPQPKDESTIDIDPLAGAAAKTAAAERSFTLDLIGAFAASGPGQSIPEIIDAIAAKKRPKPDSELKDDDGFPIFCAKNEKLNTADLLEKIQAYDERFPADFIEDEGLRTLALMDIVLPGAIAQAHALMEQPPSDFRLHVLWLIPLDWHEDTIPVLQNWLRHEYLSLLDKTRIELSVHPAATEADTLGEIDELILATRRGRTEKDLHLVIAANSAIGEKTAQSWASKNTLFTAENQSGQMPGEGVVCLLFTAKEPGPQETFGERVRISRVGRAVRDKAVDTGGRIGSTLLEQLIDGALAIRGVERAAVRKVAADSDHRASRVNELMLATGEKFKDLDPMESCLQTGSACGSNALVGSLLALACAREIALSEQGPVICISNQHPTDRAVLLVEPPPPPAEPETARV